MAGPAAGPRAVAAARVPGDLLRLAVLLEDDRPAAEQLVRATLDATGTWRRPDAVRARTALVRRSLARRPGVAARASGWVDAPSPVPAWGDHGADELGRALGALPPRTRAAAVLALVAGLDDVLVARVLRIPAAAARDEIAAGAAALRAATEDLRPPPDPVGARPDPDAGVRAALGARADALTGAPPDDREPEPGTRAAVGRARRRRTVLAGSSLALAGIVAAAVLPRGDDPVPPPEAAAAVPAAPGAGTAAVLDATAGPTRGPLAGDRAFLAALEALPWAGGPGDPGLSGFTPVPGSVRVVWAGDVAAGRWALLVARSAQGDDRPDAPAADEELAVWFAGPVGSAAAGLRPATPASPLDRGRAPALLDSASGTLVVVAAPGDLVEVSARAEIAADGSAGRDWRAARVRDGVAVAALEPTSLPWNWATSYRVVRDGTVRVTAPPEALVPAGGGTGLPDLGIDLTGRAVSAEGRQAVHWAAFSAVASLGIGPDDARITARLVEPVPAPADGTIALVTVELPSGALVVSGQWAAALPGGMPGGADCGMGVRPAGAPPEQRVLAAGCELFAPADGRALDSVLVVATPPSVTLVRAYRGNGSFAGEFPVDGGSLVVPMPAGVREVEAVTASGVQLGRTELLGRWTRLTE